MSRRLSALLLPAVLLLGLPRPAAAWVFSDRLEVYGYAQTWLTILDQAESVSGVIQYPSQHEGETATTGFRLNRLRAGVNAWVLDGLLGGSLQLSLVGNFGLLDVVLKVRPLPWLEIRAGQFKVPSTFENLEDDRSQDFILRTDLSNALADFSLSRTNYASSLFYANRSQ